METLFQNLPQHEIAPVLIVTIVMTTSLLIVASTVISLQWRKVKERQLTASLVQNMLDRGMSSTEICNVMASTGSKPRPLAAHRAHALQADHYPAPGNAYAAG